MFEQRGAGSKFFHVFRFLRDAAFFGLLRRIDEDLAELTREAGCPKCQGRLHTADYSRRVLPGLPVWALEFFATRLSFCCAARDCRKRATPPSVVFFHGRRYPAFVMVLVGVLEGRRVRSGLDQIEALLEIDLDLHSNTIARWRAWWGEVYGESEFVKRIRGRIPPRSGRLRLADVVGLLLDGADWLLDVLRLHAPLSTRSVDSEQALRWAAETRRGGETVLS